MNPDVQVRPLDPNNPDQGWIVTCATCNWLTWHSSQTRATSTHDTHVEHHYQEKP